MMTEKTPPVHPLAHLYTEPDTRTDDERWDDALEAHTTVVQMANEQGHAKLERDASRHLDALISMRARGEPCPE